MKHHAESIIAPLLKNAHEFPGKAAFITLKDGVDIGINISYHELYQRVKWIALQLSVLELEGERVILLYQEPLEFIISFLACQYSGIIPIPVAYMKNRKQFLKVVSIIKDAKATAVFSTSQSLDYLQNIFKRSDSLSEIDIVTTDSELPGPEYELSYRPVFNDISFIQYTSGSTGQPKGVVVTGRNLLANQQMIRSAFGCNRSSLILSWLPFHHDMGLVGNMLHTIYVGCTCYLMLPEDFMLKPQRWLMAISAFHITHSGGPNFSYDLCVEKISREDLRQLDLSSWKVAYNGSEPVRHETMQRFLQYFQCAGFTPVSFYPCYGLAEATLLVSGARRTGTPVVLPLDRMEEGQVFLSQDPAKATRYVVSSGLTEPGTSVKIVAGSGRTPCNELEEGEICISGESVTTTYWNKHGFDDFYNIGGKSFLRTGDTGFLHQGELFVLGRLKEMIIVSGRNIYPYDIEMMVSESNLAIEKNGVVVFSPDLEDDKIVVVAEIKRSFVRRLQTAEVLFCIDRAVTGYCGISPYDIVLTNPQGILRSTSGKLQRAACRNLYGQNPYLNAIGSKQEFFQKIGCSKVDDSPANHAIQKVITSQGGRASIREYLLAVISPRLGWDLSLPEREDFSLGEIGLDPLREMELINIINRDLAIRIQVSDLLKDNTLYGLINLIESLLWLNNIGLS